MIVINPIKALLDDKNLHEMFLEWAKHPPCEGENICDACFAKRAFIESKSIMTLVMMMLECVSNDKITPPDVIIDSLSIGFTIAYQQLTQERIKN